jgi:hypothetical protein
VQSFLKVCETIEDVKILAIDEPGPFFMVSILAILDPILITKNIFHQEH